MPHTETLMSSTGKKLRVGILFGGRSGEHEISLRSARSIVRAIDRNKYIVVELGITRDGRWLPPEDSIALLEGQTPAEIEAHPDHIPLHESLARRHRR